MSEVIALPVRRGRKPAEPLTGYLSVPEAARDNFAALEALVASARRTLNTGNFCTAERLVYAKGQMQAVSELANMIRKAIP